MGIVRKLAVVVLLVGAFVVSKPRPVQADGPCGTDCWSLQSAAQIYGGDCYFWFLANDPGDEQCPPTPLFTVYCWDPTGYEYDGICI